MKMRKKIVLSIALFMFLASSLNTAIQAKNEGKAIDKMSIGVKTLLLENRESTKVFKEIKEDDKLIVENIQKDISVKTNTEITQELNILSFLKNKKTDSIGALDWFNEGQYKFALKSNALVYDIESGKHFEIKRTYGTNHADVETLTVKDTEIVKEIWGGFSWEQRAILLVTENDIIAASMTAMPHAGLEDAAELAWVNNRAGGFGTGQNLDAVKGNNLDGHFDVHLKNSRTHSTNSINSSHQSMVNKAENFLNNNFK